MVKCIQTDAAPAAIGAYSQAIKVKDTLYCAGQIGLDPQSMTLINDDFTEQAKQAFRNLEAVLSAEGLTLQHIVKLTIYLLDFAHIAEFNAVMAASFAKPYPARSTVAVAALPKSAKIEIDAIAVYSSQSD